MVPVLSTRVFGRPPTRHDLELCRRLRLLDLELWHAPYAHRDGAALEELQDGLKALGLSVPCVHLDVRGPEGGLDLEADDPWQRRQALDALVAGLDAAVRLGARTAVVHLRLREPRRALPLFEAATERGVTLAVESDTFPGTAPAQLLDGLAQLGESAKRHGLCIDLSRTPLSPATLTAMGRRLRWVEISQRHDGQPHGPPEPTDHRLRETIGRLGLPFVAYEVVPVGPAVTPPGEAQLTLLLRRVAAFHLGEGVGTAQGTSPFLG
jgi:hypothetical protein